MIGLMCASLLPSQVASTEGQHKMASKGMESRAAYPIGPQVLLHADDMQIVVRQRSRKPRHLHTLPHWHDDSQRQLHSHTCPHHATVKSLSLPNEDRRRRASCQALHCRRILVALPLCSHACSLKPLSCTDAG